MDYIDFYLPLSQAFADSVLRRQISNNKIRQESVGMLQKWIIFSFFFRNNSCEDEIVEKKKNADRIKCDSSNGRKKNNLRGFAREINLLKCNEFETHPIFKRQTLSVSGESFAKCFHNLWNSINVVHWLNKNKQAAFLCKYFENF